ncbi:FAM98A family protein [Megaselia abdita]
MEAELDIIDSLQAIGYTGPCINTPILSAGLKNGISSNEIKKLIIFLTNEIHVLLKTDETITTTEDIDGFLMELSSLLKEIQCPFTEFMSGTVETRFQSKESLILLLEYLISELMAIRMCRKTSPEAKSFQIKKEESSTARALLGITRDLELGRPPENIAPKAIFDKVAFKLEEKVRACDPKRLREPLIGRSVLKKFQWDKLEEIAKDLEEEYNKRRNVLITRLEVTIQSFSWSDRTKQKENDILKNFQNHMTIVEQLKTGGKKTDIIALLAARTDLPIIEKTSCSSVRKNTKSQVNKHIIGNVPDRGGRAYEHAIPAPEMPSWQIQRSQGGGGGRGGGRGGFDQRPQGQRPPRNQWTQDSGRVQGVGWAQQGGGNYNDNRGNYQGGNNYQGQRGGNHNQHGGNNYQDNRNNYDNRGQNFQDQGGYQNNRGGQDQGGYHNNRGGQDRGDGYNRGGGHRGQSNYNRGGYNNRR